jgi:hypothetical protein
MGWVHEGEDAWPAGHSLERYFARRVSPVRSTTIYIDHNDLNDHNFTDNNFTDRNSIDHNSIDHNANAPSTTTPSTLPPTVIEPWSHSQHHGRVQH